MCSNIIYLKVKNLMIYMKKSHFKIFFSFFMLRLPFLSIYISKGM